MRSPQVQHILPVSMQLADEKKELVEVVTVEMEAVDSD